MTLCNVNPVRRSMAYLDEDIHEFVLGLEEQHEDLKFETEWDRRKRDLSMASLDEDKQKFLQELEDAREELKNKREEKRKKRQAAKVDAKHNRWSLA